MKRADRGALRLGIDIRIGPRLGLSAFARTGNKLSDALLHFTRGFVGKSHRQDISRGDPFLNEVSDAIGDDPGLASPCPRQDQKRSIESLDSFALLRVS